MPFVQSSAGHVGVGPVPAGTTAPAHVLDAARPQEPDAGHQLQSVRDEGGADVVASTAVHDAHDVCAEQRLAGVAGGAGHVSGDIIEAPAHDAPHEFELEHHAQLADVQFPHDVNAPQMAAEEHDGRFVVGHTESFDESAHTPLAHHEQR